MRGKKAVFKCVEPESLVVIMAFPLCDLFSEQKDAEPFCSFEMATQGEMGALDACAGAVREGCALPLRCACFMDCADAVALMQEVGDVVF